MAHRSFATSRPRTNVPLGGSTCTEEAPVVTVRPTVFLEGFFRLLAAAGVRASDELALPMGGGKTSPISTVDVARAVAAILDDPAPHIGQIYDLTGPESADLDHYARVFSEALGRPIRFRDVPLRAWSESLRQARGFLSTSSAISRPSPS